MLGAWWLFRCSTAATRHPFNRFDIEYATFVGLLTSLGKSSNLVILST